MNYDDNEGLSADHIFEKNNLIQTKMPGKDELTEICRRHDKEIKDYVERSGDVNNPYHPSTIGCNGLADSRNPAQYLGLEWNNCYHRSDSEIDFHKALVKKNASFELQHGAECSFVFWVLPVGIQRKRKRIELDFLILWQGQYIGIEIDGDCHIDKSHFDEEERLKNLKNNFMDIIRIRPSSSEDNWSVKAVDDLFKYLNRKRLSGK